MADDPFGAKTEVEVVLTNYAAAPGLGNLVL
jgi:hypothetical protein